MRYLVWTVNTARQPFSTSKNLISRSVYSDVSYVTLYLPHVFQNKQYVPRLSCDIKRIVEYQIKLILISIL